MSVHPAHDIICYDVGPASVCYHIMVTIIISDYVFVLDGDRVINSFAARRTSYLILASSNHEEWSLYFREELHALLLVIECVLNFHDLVKMRHVGFHWHILRRQRILRPVLVKVGNMVAELVVWHIRVLQKV